MRTPLTVGKETTVAPCAIALQRATLHAIAYTTGSEDKDVIAAAANILGTGESPEYCLKFVGSAIPRLDVERRRYIAKVL